MAKQTNEQILEQLMREGSPLAQKQAINALNDLKTDLSRTMKETLETTKTTGRITKQSADSQKESVEISKVANQNIKDVKEGQKELISLAKQTNGLLNNLISASSKYYESNNELLQNLLLKNSLHSDKLNDKLQDIFSKQKSAATNASVDKGEGPGPSVIGDVLGTAALAEIAKKLTDTKAKSSAQEDKASSKVKTEEVDKASSKVKTEEVDKASSKVKTEEVDKASSGKATARQKTTFEQMAEEAKKGEGKIEPKVSMEPETKSSTEPSPARRETVGGKTRLEPTLSPAPETATITPQASEQNIVWNEKAGRWQDINAKGKPFVSNKVAADLGLTKPGTVSPGAVNLGEIKPGVEGGFFGKPEPKVAAKGGYGIKGGALLGAAIGIISDLSSNPKLEEVENAKAKIQSQLASGKITMAEASEAFKQLDIIAARARGEAVTYSGLKEGIAGAVGTVAGVASTPVATPIGGFAIGTGVGIAASEGLDYAAEKTGAKGVLQSIGEVGGEYTQRFINRARDELNPLMPGTISSAEQKRKEDILSAKFTDEEKRMREEALRSYNEASDRALAEASMYGPEAAAFAAPSPELNKAQSNYDKIMADTEAARKKRELALKKSVEASQKLDNKNIEKVGSGPSSGASNVTVINQGDTVNNNVSNGNAGGNQVSSGVGSPSGPPSPYDERLYGSSNRRNAY
jgi:hypothetical protein